MLDCTRALLPIVLERIVDISMSLSRVSRVLLSIIADLFVLEPPEILRSHINTRPSVVRGSSITLSCPYTTERSVLATKINTTWIPPLFGNDHRRSRQDLKLNENQLTISNVQLEDGQRWTCVVANEYGSDSLEFELEILGKISLLRHGSLWISVLR